MIREVLLPNVQIALFDSQAAYQAGRLRAHLRKQGRPIDFPDLQIAAIALSKGLILVTGNVDHFTPVNALPQFDLERRCRCGKWRRYNRDGSA